MRPFALLTLVACADAEPAALVGDDTPADTDAVDSPADDGAPDDTPPADAPDDADPDVQTWVPVSQRPEAPVRLILLGDSITAGYGVERGEPGYAALLQHNDTEAWPAWDGLDLTTTRPTLTQVIDVSQGGAKTGDVLDDQIREVKRQLGDLPVDGESLVVFTIGGNDAQAALFPGADATRIVDGALANLEHIIQALQDPGVFTTPPAIYATNIYEPTDGQGQARACFLGLDFSAKLSELDRYDAAFLDLAETYGFAAVDLHHHFLGHGYHSDRDVNPFYDPDDPTLWFASDCIHPNERGHHELRRLFWYAIEGEALPLHDL